MSRMSKRDYDYEGVDWGAVNKNIEKQEDRKLNNDVTWDKDQTDLERKN